MADQPDDNNSDGGPKVEFKEIHWPGPVVIPGPMPNDEKDDGDKNNGEGPSTRLDNGTLGDLVVVPGPASDAYHGDGNVQPVQKVAAVDSLVSSEVDQLERFSVTEGRVRDSLELYHQRLSRSSSTVSPFTGGERKKPTPDIRPFCPPSTMLRPIKVSHALKVVQPYPNPSGFKRARTAPVDLGPCTHALPIRHPGPTTVTYMPDGSVIATKVPSEQPQNDEGKAAKASRRFSLADVVARVMGKDKTKGNRVAPEQSRGVLKRQKLTARDKGKGKAVEFVDPGEPSRGKDNPKVQAVGPAQVGVIPKQQSIMKGGQGQGEAVGFADAGQSALHKDGRAASDRHAGATQEARDGKQQQQQQANVLKTLRRKVRKVVDQHLKLHALFK